jgi:lipopolysaccharide transport system permease protein
VGIGFFLVPIGGLYGDVERALGFLLLFWFFVTPVVYPPPEGALFALIDRFNPISPLLIGTKELVTMGVLSDPLRFGVVSGLALVLLFVGWVLFRLSIPILVERMSA